MSLISETQFPFTLLKSRKEEGEFRQLADPRGTENTRLMSVKSCEMRR